MNRTRYSQVCKSAVNYYLHRGGSPEQITHLVPYLKGSGDSDSVNHYVPAEPFFTMAPTEIMHCIHVEARPEDHLLFAYVEFFSVDGFLVVLNRHYSGPALNSSYCYDVLGRKEVTKSVTVSLSSEKIKTYDSRVTPVDYGLLRRNFGRFLHIAIMRQDEVHRDNLIERAIKKSLGKYPEGCTITPQMLDETVQELMKELTPYIINRAQRRRGR